MFDLVDGIQAAYESIAMLCSKKPAHGTGVVLTTVIDLDSPKSFHVHLQDTIGGPKIRSSEGTEEVYSWHTVKHFLAQVMRCATLYLTTVVYVSLLLMSQQVLIQINI